MKVVKNIFVTLFVVFCVMSVIGIALMGYDKLGLLGAGLALVSSVVLFKLAMSLGKAEAEFWNDIFKFKD